MELITIFLQSFLLLFFFFLPSIYLYKVYYHKSPLKTYPILGNVPDFLQNRHRFLEWTTEILTHMPTNTFTFRRPSRVQGILTANPQNVEHMLKTNFLNYPKGQGFIHMLEDLLGRGIFNCDGELWHIQRKTASFEFNTKSLRTFIIQNVRREIQTRLIPLLEKAAESSEVLDLQDVFERFAFDNICLLAFNVDTACLGEEGTEGHEFMHAFEEAAMISADRLMYAIQYVWMIKRFFSLGSERRLKKSIKTVHEFAEKIVRSKMKEKNSTGTDLLSRFIASTDSDGLEMKSVQFLRDVVISFILAGRDTSSAALSWFFWLLSSHPHVEENILEEIKTTRKRNGTCIGDMLKMEELSDMHYLHAAISEAMRLYPPVTTDTKICLEDDVMPDGTFVRKEWFVLYNTYAMGRMESIWGKDCCQFVPERWLENGKFRVESAFKYPVFHAGPRMCLGKDMAYIQMKSVAASIIERFTIEAVDKGKIPGYVLSLTLRMKQGLMVRLRTRLDIHTDS